MKDIYQFTGDGTSRLPLAGNNLRRWLIVDTQPEA